MRFFTALALLALPNQLLAAGSTGYQDHAWRSVYIFLGLCGLIIFAQLMIAWGDHQRPGLSAEEKIQEAEEKHSAHHH